MAEARRFLIIVEEGGPNFSAYSPDLPGCVSTGSTIQETIENMKEAIGFHLQGMQEDALPPPQSSTIAAQIITV